MRLRNSVKACMSYRSYHEGKALIVTSGSQVKHKKPVRFNSNPWTLAARFSWLNNSWISQGHTLRALSNNSKTTIKKPTNHLSPLELNKLLRASTTEDEQAHAANRQKGRDLGTAPTRPGLGKLCWNPQLPAASWATTEHSPGSAKAASGPSHHLALQHCLGKCAIFFLSGSY